MTDGNLCLCICIIFMLSYPLPCGRCPYFSTMLDLCVLWPDMVISDDINRSISGGIRENSILHLYFDYSYTFEMNEEFYVSSVHKNLYEKTQQESSNRNLIWKKQFSWDFKRGISTKITFIFLLYNSLQLVLSSAKLSGTHLKLRCNDNLTLKCSISGLQS